MKTNIITLLLFCAISNGIAQNADSSLLDPIEIASLTTSQSSTYFGNSISFSNDGKVLAVGEYTSVNQDNEINGRVQVYESQSGIWVQKGQDLFGIDDLFNHFGRKVELSSDGNTLAVYDSQSSFTLSPGQTIEDLLGPLAPQYFIYIQVYKFMNGAWVQVGNNFLGSPSDFSLSGNGNTLAIEENNGVDVYTLIGNTWTLIGQQIPDEGTLPMDVIDLSEDGNTLVIGNAMFSDPNSPANPSHEGQVKVYQNSTNTWTQLGNTLLGTDTFQFFGSFVGISADGNIIAVASDLLSDDDQVSTYELVGSNWIQKGSTITQGVEEIISMDFLGNGSAIAIADGSGARVFKFDTDWGQVNRAVNIDAINSDFGNSIAVANSGDLFAVGVPFINSGGVDSGLVYIYGTNPNVNLLFNGSAEILPVIGNGWTQTIGNTTAVEGSGTSNPAKDGDYFFYANTTPLSEFFQDVDVTSFATEIDTGNKSFKFSGYFRSFNQGNPDQGQAILEYKDVNDIVLDTYDSGLIASIDIWTLFEDTRVAPIGTRSVTVTLFQKRNAGTNNDGYIDDIIFQEALGLLIPDPNFEQALIELNIDTDGVINGQLSEGDPNGVIALDVSSKNILNLTGIEYFTDLETLDASNNNLPLVVLSENTGLISLTLDNNQLNALDVSLLLGLEYISVSGNLLTDLSLNTNSNLEFLDASDNELFNLDIRNGNNSNIPNSNFNVLNNPNLTCISVDNVNYSNTNWSAVDAQTDFSTDCLATNPNNLVFNGSAEILPILDNGWTQVSGNWQGAESSIDEQDGINLFFAGANSTAELFQDVDVSAFASLIDTGLQSFYFSCHLRSFNQIPADESRALVEYKDNSGEVLSTYDTGSSNNITEWVEFNDLRLAPLGTRTIRITLFSNRNSGSNNDGWTDNVLLLDGNSSIINIPDPNFEQALIDLNIDTDGIINGQMVEFDALGVESLDVSNQNISDLTGIEFFEDLEDLVAFNNSISTIDLTQNTQLETLILAINNLSAIDISNNPQLISLSLNENDLTSLDISNNLNLLQLFANDNDLNTLDVSLLSNLENLGVFGNDLIALDLSQNSNLTTLFCNDNNLLSLNVQNGNNIIITNFEAQNNLDLTCIQVDDVTYSDTNWPNIDEQVFFSLDCTPSNDDCQSAQLLDVGTLINGTTVNATSNIGFNLLNCQGEGTIIFDVWYQFTAPTSGLITATATALINDADINLAIYDDCNTVLPLTCDSANVELSNLNPGQTYYVQIWFDEDSLLARSTLNTIRDFSFLVEDTSTLSAPDLGNTLNQLQLYPNPAKNSFSFSSEIAIETVQVFDVTGKSILSVERLDAFTHTMDSSSFSKGLYFIRFSAEHKTITKKLIIK
ncbi:T9SS type A sorting domain-containing protein [Psychroserpens sp.]|uniref:T9SS type A sorting domain-containing protein n=1 Tax=Psychroserpens sp. TaxID=2020870 RepID=UPI003C74F397